MSVLKMNVKDIDQYWQRLSDNLSGCSLSDAGHIVDEIMKSAKVEYETSYRLLPDTIASPVPQNIKDEIEEYILECIEFLDDINAGIYAVII